MMTLKNLIKPGPSLDADGILTIYEIETGRVVAQYEGLEIHNQLLEAKKLIEELENALQGYGGCISLARADNEARLVLQKVIEWRKVE